MSLEGFRCPWIFFDTYLLQKCVECRCRREIVTKSVDNFQVRVLTVDEGSNIELRPALP